MSNTMKTFDTQPLMHELNSVLNDGITKMLSKYVKRYNLLEQTHTQIMNLPSVRAEMNKDYESDSDSSNDSIECMPHTNNCHPDVLAAHIDTISNLRNEICGLKELLSKRHSCNCNKNDTCEKINIKLEIVDILTDDVIVSKKCHTVECDNFNDEATDKEDEEDEDAEEAAGDVDADDEEEEDEEDEEDEEEEDDDTDEEDADEDEDVTDPVVTDPIVIDPVVIDPVVTDPIVIDPDVTDPVVTDPVVIDPVVIDPIVVSNADDDVETEKSDDDDEDEFFEIEIDDVTYCTNDEEHGIIYEMDKDGDVGPRIGYLKDGEPFFDNE